MLYNKIVIFLLVILLLSGCGKTSQPIMNIPAEDGQYHYRNSDLGFNITLPPEFIYYQTQRTNGPEFTDLEFYVPTNDPDYIEYEVPSYAKPVVIRIYKGSYWDEMKAPDEANMIFKKIAEKNDKVYTIKFWDKFPSDWKEKWTEDMKQKIKNNFELD